MSDAPPEQGDPPVRGVHANTPVRGAHGNDPVRGAHGNDPVQRARPGRPRRIGILVAVATGIFTVDLITKTIVVAPLSPRPPVRLLGGLLTLRVLRNSGAAFSIGTSMTVVFTLIA